MQEGEKNPWLHLDSLEPDLRLNTKQSGWSHPANFMDLFHRNPEEWLIIFMYPFEA